MSIIATAPVRVTSRLDLADTGQLLRCPTWCSGVHDVDGLHEHTVEITATNAALTNEQATAAVIVHRYDDETTAPALVRLAVTEGAEAGYPGFQGTLGWAGTPEQAERLALALIEGARIVREIAAGAR